MTLHKVGFTPLVVTACGVSASAVPPGVLGWVPAVAGGIGWL